MSETPVHVPVLLDEVLAGLDSRGRSSSTARWRWRAAAPRPAGPETVIALDRDPAAVQAAEASLQGWNVLLGQSNYADFPEVLGQLGLAAVDGILLDLGLSSDQLADRERGFSFAADGPLDMRFDPQSGEPAWRLLNRCREETLSDIIARYGEERFHRRIARAVVQQRRQGPIETAGQLANLVRRVVPRRPQDRIDPATRTFQALRIAVNERKDERLQRIRVCVQGRDPVPFARRSIVKKPDDPRLLADGRSWTERNGP